METLTSNAQLINSGHQKKHTTQLKHLSKRLRRTYKE